MNGLGWPATCAISAVIETRIRGTPPPRIVATPKLPPQNFASPLASCARRGRVDKRPVKPVSAVVPSVHASTKSVLARPLSGCRLTCATAIYMAGLADRVLVSGRSIDFMIDNAGVMAVAERTLLGPGWEMQFATNHLGHFALVNRLWPAIAADGGARVVSVSSRGHHRSPVRWEDPHSEHTPYDKWAAYGQAKTANVLFAVQFVDWTIEFVVNPVVGPGAAGVIQTSPTRSPPRTAGRGESCRPRGGRLRACGSNWAITAQTSAGTEAGDWRRGVRRVGLQIEKRAATISRPKVWMPATHTRSGAQRALSPARANDARAGADMWGRVDAQRRLSMLTVRRRSVRCRAPWRTVIERR